METNTRWNGSRRWIYVRFAADLTNVRPRVYWNGLPSFIFGVAAFTAGLSTLLVPDVANNVLPDTVH
ncbi:jg14982 [Pararge aegeria aegeria]|uniref:Jg14982 protein n=1 Tax=Pararge aegeria aegeria TaxID=348720 RepID=A0A8S4S940_9NEOP|nr:jg14982 [Pararge aegeria aegeria]